MLSCPPRTLYEDLDGDGFGNEAKPTEDFVGVWPACSPPPGQVDDKGDCDDARATVNPDAKESCNGRDDDCDGVKDSARGSPASGNAVCPAGCRLSAFKQHTYAFCEAIQEWFSAGTLCQSHGMALLSIDSLDENDWVFSQIQMGQAKGCTWTVANDRAEEGLWLDGAGEAFWKVLANRDLAQHPTGEPVLGKFSRWAEGKPTVDGPDCGCVASLKLTNTSCQDRLPFICEAL